MSSSSPLPVALQPARPMHPILTLLPVFIIFFLFLRFLSIIFFRNPLHHFLPQRPSLPLRFFLCCPTSNRRNDGPTLTNNAGARQGRAEPCLYPVIISSFHTFSYSAVTGLQERKCEAECTVCLSEFNRGDVIRLLTVCCYAFHKTCIDSWLALHSTCPVFWSDLKALPDEKTVLPVREVVGGGVLPGSHVIVIEDESKASSRGHSVVSEDREEEGRVLG